MLRTIDRCFICGRREGEITLQFEGRIVSCCDTCYQRGEDEVRVPLDMEEGDEE